LPLGVLWDGIIEKDIEAISWVEEVIFDVGGGFSLIKFHGWVYRNG
jgi:hypothetical protein